MLTHEVGSTPGVIKPQPGVVYSQVSSVTAASYFAHSPSGLFIASPNIDWDNPKSLLGSFDRLRPGQLSQAAEIVGNALSSSEVVPALIELLDHARPIAREGAVIGLRKHLSYPGVREKLVEVYREDPVLEVRETALEILEEF